MTDAVATAFAALAVLLQVLLVIVALTALASLAFGAARRALTEMRHAARRRDQPTLLSLIHI